MMSEGRRSRSRLLYLLSSSNFLYFSIVSRIFSIEDTDWWSLDEASFEETSLFERGIYSTISGLGFFVFPGGEGRLKLVVWRVIIPAILLSPPTE